ncbi:sugar kinase [Aquitalea aquatica]|nr:sugar kinase [Aquitalea magnusonii]
MHIACLGEGMIELSGQPLQRRFGGDTLNTAIYLARLLAGSPHDVRYLSGMGNDSLSRQLLADWQAEGVDVSHIVIQPGKLPGLYMVETDAKGERSFLYWRSDSAARHYFASGIDFASLLNPSHLQAVYLSGISLALFNETERQRLLEALRLFKQAGGKIWFDNNFRPSLWTAAQARSGHEAILALADIGLLTLDDERALYGNEDAEAVASRTLALGCTEVVIKRGGEPCLLAMAELREEVFATAVPRVVDTTAAGDSFAAGYLASRTQGYSPSQAAAYAHRLSAAVIAHAGAIIPLAAMPLR